MKQVGNAERTPRVYTQTKDHGAQTALPVQRAALLPVNADVSTSETHEKVYIGGRLVPSPSSYISRSNSSMEQAIEVCVLGIEFLCVLYSYLIRIGCDSNYYKISENSRKFGRRQL